MCGLVGFIDFNKNSDLDILKDMNKVIHHRGPDDERFSFYEKKSYQIGLAHKRLSILDLSNHGHQPMKFDNIEIIYNGNEITNNS